MRRPVRSGKRCKGKGLLEEAEAESKSPAGRRDAAAGDGCDLIVRPYDEPSASAPRRARRRFPEDG